VQSLSARSEIALHLDPNAKALGWSAIFEFLQAKGISYLIEPPGPAMGRPP